MTTNKTYFIRTIADIASIPAGPVRDRFFAELPAIVETIEQGNLMYPEGSPGPTQWTDDGIEDGIITGPAPKDDE